jgi:hypothetical protein
VVHLSVLSVQVYLYRVGMRVGRAAQDQEDRTASAG